MPNRRRGNNDQYRGLVAVILAAAMGTFLVAVSVGLVVVEARAIMGGATLTNPISENATQVMTGLIGGIIGVLAGFVGSRTGEAGDPPRPPKGTTRETTDTHTATESPDPAAGDDDDA